MATKILTIQDIEIKDLINFCIQNHTFEQDSQYDKFSYYNRIIKSILQSGQNHKILCVDKKIQVFLSYHQLDFDTHFFETNTARISFLAIRKDSLTKIIEQFLKLCLQEIEDSGIKFLQTKIDSRSIKTIQSLLKKEFIFTAENVVLHSKIGKNIEMPENVFIASESDISQIHEISIQVYRNTRFHNDPNIDLKKACEMQGTWAKNCIKEKLADVVFIEKQENTIRGYISCKVINDPLMKNNRRHARIILVAVDKKYTGKGIGTKLIKAAFKWANGLDIEEMIVGTQITNIPALKYYQKNNFTIINSDISLHKWF